ncbi:hypothetical protein AGDE_12692 [Angomonas deanei]|uniref:Lysine methyltransferase, putative n=1 Tax=Angomonas deanei TaxID=59799 RepID=A0A7G2C6Q1_9TRYP|nr:hypothetical protein AGDE_12692 [Angomonas deanei]CAD2215145.1 Lysine methyltransferase, putative [Angomonas deanei]|eukprot:EPY24016.1 hypothetical protein AGDE_12692 [Angomonas deanei]
MKSRNVHLCRRSTSPITFIREKYGDLDGVERQIEEQLLAANRRLKQHLPCEDVRVLTDLTTLLQAVERYASLGPLGGVTREECAHLVPLLTRLVKSCIAGGFEVVAPEEEGSLSLSDQLLEACTAALSNCDSGVACRTAETQLTITLADLPSPCAVCQTGGTLQVHFGFADYTAGETGARLWAGAVGLSLYLVEHLHELFPTDTVAAPIRVVELGCGPGLASLVLATLLDRHRPLLPPVQLDVTDVSAAVISEVQKSFAERNGPSLAALLPAGDSEMTAPLQANCFLLDFADIPESLAGQYQLLIASDIVYDYTIAKHVPPALVRLLAKGGSAVLCCEQHRDGMNQFVDEINQQYSDTLEVVMARNVTETLSHLEMIHQLCATYCTLLMIRRK